MTNDDIEKQTVVVMVLHGLIINKEKIAISVLTTRNKCFSITVPLSSVVFVFNMDDNGESSVLIE
jgi:hypothetical protein